MDRAKRYAYLRDIEGKSIRKAALEVGYKRTKAEYEYDKVKTYLKATEPQFDAAEIEEPVENEDLKSLKETTRANETVLKKIKEREAYRKKNEQQLIEIAETEEGLQLLFSNPEKMLEFDRIASTYTAPSLIDMIFNPNVIVCRKRGIVLCAIMEKSNDWCTN